MFKQRMGLALSLCLVAVVGCNGPAPTERTLTADVPLHLEEHLAVARIEGSEVPKDLPEPLEWRYEKDIEGWKAIVPFKPGIEPLQVSHQNDALRLTLTKENRNPWGYRMGTAYVDLPDLNREDWGFIVIGARTNDDITWISPFFNLREKLDDDPGRQGTFVDSGDTANVINDGEVHTYLIGTESSWSEVWKGPWKQLGIAVGSSNQELDDSRKGPISIDIVSVSVIPKEAAYAKLRAGTSWESWGEVGHRVLYTHVPGKLEYDVAIPKKGRLDVGLGLLKKNIPVNFKISARERGADSGPGILLEETCSGDMPRVQRSLDLSSLSGKTVTLALETEAERPGNIAFWGAPTLSGPRTTVLPNIIFYVIDGAAAEFMSIYGYNRRTTPYLERLAAEGAVFENAYSNSSQTSFSVPSFMTSLHSSVLGGHRAGSNALPEQAVTMAERMHKAGYLTEVLTSNPYCGRVSSLDRGVDSMIDTEPEAERDNDPLAASAALHRYFWELRDAYPGEPYWVHFQPTDVHRPWRPVAPFAGLFATLEERRIFDEMTKKMEGVQQFQNFADRIEKAGVDKALYSQISRKIYDESMAHQDYTIGKLVERIKGRGEWENTLFIVAADHSHASAGLPLLDPRLPKYYEPLLAAQVSRIPMIFVWPGKISPGRRLTQPVSMIDMLPTILDLAGLPGLEITQGQSLAPLLLGKPGWTHRPIVFDEFYIIGNYFFGSIEVIDGRWGASLSIDTRPDDKKTPWDRARPAPLLIFDVWEDPHAFKSLHEERPDLVEKYSKMLNGIYKEHETLAKKFSRAADVPLTSQQIETLRSLGYLR